MKRAGPKGAAAPAGGRGGAGARKGRNVGATSRRRGYSWEDTLVKRFRGKPGWKAFRLGSPSVGLPDVLAVNTGGSLMYVIEAKAGTSTSLFVPGDQIRRCLEWVAMFDVYKTRHVLLAFKFLSKKRTGGGTYGSRELREFYKVWDRSMDVADCTCTYDGRLFAKTGGSRTQIILEECAMPFKTKQRKGTVAKNGQSVTQTKKGTGRRPRPRPA